MRRSSLRTGPSFASRTNSAIAVAAHEAGHAIQHKRDYAPLGFRSAVVPAAGIGSQLWPLFFFAGLLFSFEALIWVGILLFAGIVSTAEETEGVSKVLGAAAMTYVAGALTAIATLLYLLVRARD